MSIDRRLAALEDALAARKQSKRIHTELDLAELEARWAAYERKKQVFEALTTAEKIKAKEVELAELQQRESDPLMRYRIRLAEVCIEELQGVAAEVCEEARAEATAAVTGRRYEKPGEWQPPVREHRELEEGDPDEQPVLGHRPRLPALSDARRMHDRLEHYRSTGCVWLEPDRP
jgi:hypothetical protein